MLRYIRNSRVSRLSLDRIAMCNNSNCEYDTIELLQDNLVTLYLHFRLNNSRRSIELRFNTFFQLGFHSDDAQFYSSRNWHLKSKGKAKFRGI